MSNDNEIKVALTADYAGLQQGMEAGEEVVVESSETMATAVEQAQAQIVAAHAAIGESAEAASVRLRTMVQASLAQVESATAVGESERSLAERLGLRVEATAAQVEATQAAIAAQNMQMVSTEGMLEAESAVTTATTAATAAVGANTEAMVINGGVAREMGVLIGEGARGNFARLEGSSITLANRLGLMQGLFTGTGAAAVGLAGGVAAAVYGFVEGEREAGALNTALISTQNYAGLTTGTFESLAQKLAATGAPITVAKTGLLELAQSGRVTGEQMEMAGEIAVNMSKMTGESIEESVKQVLRLAEDPVRAVEALDAQYHFLDVTTKEEIESMQRSGDTVGATTVAMKALQGATTDAANAIRDHEGTFQRLVDRWHNGVGAMKDDLLSIGRPTTLEDNFKVATEQYERLKKAMAEGQTTAVSQTGPRPIDIETLPIEVALENARKKAYDLQEQIKGANNLASANAASAAEETATKAAQTRYDAEFGSIDRVNQRLTKTMELENELAQIHKTNPGDSRLQGIDFDENGQVSGGEKLAALLADINKKYQDIDTTTRAQREAARAAAAEQKRENAEALNDMEQRRMGTQAATSERIQADAALLASATKLYGADSSQQRSALAEMLSDEKAYNASVIKVREATLDAEHEQQVGELATKKSQYELDYQNETINAQRLAQLERQLVAQRLAIDIQYYQQKKTLDASQGDSAKATKDDSGIVAAKQHATQQLNQIDTTYLKNSEKQWQQYGHTVGTAMQTAINGMIFQHTRLKQAIGQTAATMGEDFIRAAVEKPLEKWISAEAGKLASSIATAIGVSTANDTQQAADDKADQVAAAKSIARAAGVAGANGVASFAAAPWPIDIAAPGFGASMAGIAASYGAVSSAAGGWENIPSDQLAMVHKNEMVLPAHIADYVRSGAAGGGGQAGGGDTNHFHIHANDARSFSDFLRRGGGQAIAKHFKTTSANSLAGKS